MSDSLDRTCPQCGGVQVFSLEYQAPEYDVNVPGGWSASLMSVAEARSQFWEEDDLCHCIFTDAELTELNDAMSEDYEPNDDPYGVD